MLGRLNTRNLQRRSPHPGNPTVRVVCRSGVGAAGPVSVAGHAELPAHDPHGRIKSIVVYDSNLGRSSRILMIRRILYRALRIQPTANANPETNKAANATRPAILLFPAKAIKRAATTRIASNPSPIASSSLHSRPTQSGGVDGALATTDGAGRRLFHSDHALRSALMPVVPTSLSPTRSPSPPRSSTETLAVTSFPATPRI